MGPFQANTLGLSLVLFSCMAFAAPEQRPGPEQGLSMSRELHQLFLDEMGQLLGGVRATAAAIPEGNWEAIAKTARTMRESYVLERKLTQAQEQELGTLPADFRALDADFHLRAAKLENAARANDAELVSYEFSRLLEDCTSCHAKFAHSRFPSLAVHHEEPHH